MSGAVVAVAQVIQWPIAFAALCSPGRRSLRQKRWGPDGPRTGLALLDVGHWCSRVARRMFPVGR
jgi:hypothetical protein